MDELDNAESEIVTFTAALQPGLTRIKVTATQDQKLCEDEGIVTVTDSLLTERNPEVLLPVLHQIKIRRRRVQRFLCRIPNRSVARDTLEAPGSPISNRGTLSLRQDLK